MAEPIVTIRLVDNVQHWPLKDGVMGKFALCVPAGRDYNEVPDEPNSKRFIL
ncbi:hypothetical protein NBRC116494_29030 [Aurantivibrio plasticivorans]